MTDFSIIKRLFQIDVSCGYTDDDLTYWVKMYGSVPKVLKDYYTQFGKHKNLNSTQDFLITPSQFDDYADAEYLIFYSEN